MDKNVKYNQNQLEIQVSQEQSQENKKKILSDERNIKKNKEPKKSKYKPMESELNNKISKMRFSPKKKKRISMYLVFTIFCSLLLACLIITHYYFNNVIKIHLYKNKNFSLLLFICLLIGSLILSAFASFCECFLRTHLFGILFFIILNLSINYCIIYLIIFIDYFEQIFCTLVIFVSGSIGLLIIALLVKDDTPATFILLIFNGIFSFVAGCIMCLIYNKIWNILFSILAFIISELNVYSSQYQFGSKKKKRKEIFIYSQPFELIISIFKFFYLILYPIFKALKIICENCKCEKKEKVEIKKDNKKIENKKGEEEDGEEEGEGQVEFQENKGEVKIDESHGDT